jgi:hypothetical protein
VIDSLFMGHPKTTALAAVLLATLAGSAKGLEFGDAYERNGTAMRLSGSGFLHFGPLLKGAEAAFYLGDGVAPGQSLEDVPRRIEIEYLWSIPAEVFASVTMKQIRRNVDTPTLDRILPAIQRLGRLYADVEPGDCYSLTYFPGVGTELALNGHAVGLIEGKEFSMAVFSIWIGNRPVDAKLRQKLLSRSRPL